MPLAAPLQQLSRQQDLPISLGEAWGFFSRPENLAKITPQDLGFEVISTVPEQMYAGMIVSYRVRPLAGLALPWVTEITHVREPLFFVDEQRSGPYRLWHHQHHFEVAESGVRMTDLVHYQLPFGWPGHLLCGGFVSSRLRRIFDFRSEALSRLFC